MWSDQKRNLGGRYSIRILVWHLMRVEQSQSNNSSQANAVSRIDNLSFLEDIVPRTTTYKEFKTRKTRAANVDNMTIANGQTRLDASSGALDKLAPSSYDPYDAVSVGPGGKGSQDLIQAPGSADTGPRTRDQQLIFEHYEPSGNRVDQPGDIDMG